MDQYTNTPVHAKLTTLVLWHLEDPVDDWERNRNDIIYYDYQNNRNPFIDHPEFVDEIWGYVLELDSEVVMEKKDPELVKVVDVLGREVKVQRGIAQFYIYSDGSVVKRVLE